MDEQIMQLWSISSVSKGSRHTAIVQDVNMQEAITRYCNRFPDMLNDIVTIEGRALRLNRYDDFGKMIPGVVVIPS